MIICDILFECVCSASGRREGCEEGMQRMDPVVGQSRNPVSFERAHMLHWAGDSWRGGQVKPKGSTKWTHCQEAPLLQAKEVFRKLGNGRVWTGLVSESPVWSRRSKWAGLEPVSPIGHPDRPSWSGC